MDPKSVTSLEENIREIIFCDSWREFVTAAKELLQKNKPAAGSVNIFPAELLKLICLHNAVDCATALLEGETKWSVDLNVILEGGFSPLQIAAQRLCCSMIKLFLMHGADPNMSAGADPEKLPLYMALETLSRHFVCDWTAEKSVFKLFCILCLNELREPLDTVKLLAVKTKQVETISVRCVEKGKIVELGALLLVAWHKAVASYDADLGIESCQIGQVIFKELQLLSSLECQELRLDDSDLSVRPVSLSQRKTNLDSAWKILKALETAREKLEAYRTSCKNVEAHQLPFDLASALWMHANFPVKPEDVFYDDVKCLMPKLEPENRAWLYQEIQKQMRLRQRASSAASTRHASGQMLCTRSFCTLNASKTNFAKEVSGQLAASTNSVKPPFSRFLPSAETCGRLILFAKRRYI